MVDSDIGFWSKFLMPIVSFIFAMLVALSLGNSPSPEKDQGDDKRKRAS